MSLRAKRIKEEIPILSVLAGYGYDVHGDTREQQFKCDLHGDGHDNAPSARVYPETNTWYCFACGKVRDSISTVMEKEGLDFNQACKGLEIKYNLPEWKYTPKKDYFEDSFVEPEEKEILVRKIYTLLSDKTKERTSLDICLKYWEVYNMLDSLEDASYTQWELLYSKICES